jgi:ABC-type uncharacterized transport system auxiliary subunit
MRAPCSIAWIAAAAGAAACFTGRLPPEELYRLALPDSAVTTTTSTALTNPVGGARGSIAIAPYVAPGIYGNRSLVYRIDDNEYGTYPSREWALPVGTMLGLITQDVLRQRPISDDPPTYDPPSYRVHQYVWRGVVRELEEVDRGRAVFAAVQLDARLVRAKDDSVVWSGSARLERPVPKPTMPAIVAALSQLAAEAVTRLADEARGALARSAASAGR